MISWVLVLFLRRFAVCKIWVWRLHAVGDARGERLLEMSGAVVAHLPTCLGGGVQLPSHFLYVDPATRDHGAHAAGFVAQRVVAVAFTRLGEFIGARGQRR